MDDKLNETTAMIQGQKMTSLQSAELDLENLTDTEREVLLAMLVADGDKQAIRLSPVKERQFYFLKKKLLPLRDQINIAISKKSWHVLVGSTIKAAQTLAEGLNQPSYKYRFEAAKNILDRVLGEPTKKVEARGQITILGIEIGQEQIDALTKPKTIDGADLSDSTENLQTHEDLQTTAV